MLKLAGYETLEKIHEGKHTLIFRACIEKAGQPVIFKTINDAYPDPELITRLKKEYDIMSRFQNGGVIQTLGLASVQNRPVIILEDFGGLALSKHLEKGPLDMGEFLSLALRLANTLGELHGQNIIHKDINPANIVWNRELDLVKVIDFGISLELSREITGIKNPNMLEGSLAYISPEQTGRMNRFLDYRTDYYSLGVTFFRMLAGELPFDSMDAMEMVYAHIARQAPALRELPELEGKIPRAVSDIVRKLMAKNVEDRYQSARGLAGDLNKCLGEWNRKGSIVSFAPGREDVSNRFQIPQKLYGRETEIAELLSAFERVSLGASELMLVTGRPGIGKSALVNEIQKPVVKLRGNFITGKYEKFKKDVPYSALLQTFSSLVKHLLAENEERLAHWKDKILQVLGPNGRVITEVIPELELVIGKQGELPTLGPDESRNRFNLYFRFFMGVFCKAEHPLVLFLDDLQWADHASLEMIKLFLSDEDIKYLFVIGAYRSNEMDMGHALNLTLEEIRKTGTPVHSTLVTPLKIDAICSLLSESLHQDRESSGALAELLLRKTGGNPFFLGQFMKSLYEKQLLRFSRDSGWAWDIREIKALQVTDNVVKLMAAKITRLPGDCGELLKLGACFGNSFRMETMVEITGKPGAEILAALNMLQEEGLLIKLERNYHFAHDRIQEAAYSLVPADERMQEHLRIGHLELKRTQKQELPQKVFYIANHLNVARNLLELESERLELAELNLLAGMKARSSAAYRPALNYLDIARELLGRDSWKNKYRLTLTIYQEASTSAFLWGDYKRMEELGDKLIEKARDVLDTVRVYELKIYSASAQHQLRQAVRIGLTILRRLGVRFPRWPGKFHIFLGLLSAEWALRGKSIAYLENLPEQKDPRKLAIARLIAGIGSAAYIGVPELMPLILFHMLKLSVKEGNTQFTPYTYGGYAYIHIGILGNIDRGYRFGQLALKLLDKMNVQEGRARTLLSIQYFIIPWKEHLRNTLPRLKEALRSAMETGDPEFICHVANVYVVYSLFSGRELVELEKESRQFRGLIRNLKQAYAQNQSNADYRLILNLRGLPPGDVEDKKESNFFGGPLNYSLQCYIFEQYEEALKYSDLAKVHMDSVLSSYFIPLWNFYNSLSQLALYGEVKILRRRRFLRQVRRNQKKMKRWAAHAPMNFEHKYQLVEAEKARVLKQEEKALKHYKQAIQGARENQFINEEALALECLAKFWLELGQHDIASLYLNKARQAYSSWGALAKVEDLEKNYPQLLTPGSEPSLSENAGAPASLHPGQAVSIEHSTTGSNPSGKLDLATVMKGSQAIAGEIVLSNLLRNMMKIVMQNAGARSGYLILENSEGLFVEAAGNLESEEVRVLQSLPLESCQGLSPAVVQYVARAQENVVLNDAANVGNFTTDEHIARHKPKSILCSPILNQGKLSAILYLENNLSRGAFTADRLEVLNLLSSQIAVSIDNARLYANLEEKVQERTVKLRDTLEQAQALKNKQDGDYFLTSMLIGPLARNEVKSERVMVDFLVFQKKKFKYEKWEDELGGDICIAHSLILENSPHTVFLNADAMGRSMQGAGGALVLGAVFQSIIERTRLASFDVSQSAAVWLTSVFRELQKVFESFDGRMLVSLVLGTVHEGTGRLQMLNAEHPRTVLYRNGKANFIEEDILLYELGAPEQGDSIHIHETHLRAGDVLIAGSDGRDELLFLADQRRGAGADKNIKSYEAEFLLRVQEGEGDLVKIKAALMSKGELTDDLSLLRLGYK